MGYARILERGYKLGRDKGHLRGRDKLGEKFLSMYAGQCGTWIDRNHRCLMGKNIHLL